MDHYAADVQPDPAEFPNTIMRRRTSTAHPDDMVGIGPEPFRAGDQAAPSTANTADSVAGDVDTCRICRGEATSSEPLFYPCKCSGSIKYVHQDCLMEWLSHSQKKHCELCKTPFRFTKLYSPSMPKSLPFYVFASHMATYLLSNILVWLRAALVTSVWLGCLPYMMRWVWSFLFWISDEGFGSMNQVSMSPSSNTTMAHLNLVAFTMATQGLTTNTCPSGPLFPASTTAANKRHIAEQMPDLLQAAASPLHLNVSGIKSFTASVSRLLFGGNALSAERSWSKSVNESSISWSLPHHETLLSEVSFLKNLTPHPMINSIVIRIFEGQIITILVIVCFILIILVRDYVVQQQPEINMRAAFAAQMNNPDEAQEIQQAQMPQVHIPVEMAAEEGHLAADIAVRDDESMIAQDGEAADRYGAFMPEELQPRQRPIAEFRRRIVRRDTAEDDLGGPVTSHPATPLMPPRAPLDTIARDRFFESLDEESQTTVNQYLRIYRQANGDRDNILRIIREEGLEQRLSYWVNATRAMTNSGSSASSSAASIDGGPSSASAPIRSLAAFDTDLRRRDDGLRQPAVPVHVLGDVGSASQHSSDSSIKGKQRAVDEDPEVPSLSLVEDVRHWTGPESSGSSTGDEAMDANPLHLSPSNRPRAVSDGPPLHDRIHPFANGSWSFAALPPSASNVDERPEAMPTFETLSADQTATQHKGQDEARGGISEPANTQMSDLAAGESGQSDSSWVNVEVEEAPVVPAVPEEATAVQDTVPEAEIPQPPGGLVARVADFMWGDIDAGADANGQDALELFIDDQNAPFMELNRNDDTEDEEDDIDGVDDIVGEEVAADVMEAAAAAGIDPEAIEDAEDFDGVMELLGMRGPIGGLFQNAIFCAFLVSITIFFGIFLPYNVGRLAIWVGANPMRIVRMILSVSRFIQDGCLFAVGWTTSFVFDILCLVAKLFHLEKARVLLASVSSDARELTVESLSRIWDSIVYETTFISSNEVRNFSVVSHEALITVKSHARVLSSALTRSIVFLLGGNYAPKWQVTKSTFATVAPYALDLGKNLTAAIMRPSSWMINLSIPESAGNFDPLLAYWNGTDRTLAIMSGYISMSVLAGLYLGRGTPFSSGNTAQEWEASIIDVLNQASGVMKVILIISIEMLVFPLYCGLLLDFALLPLFESTSFRSRLLFTYNYPLTSMFVHWFVGTGYMFHFALFVSMCRKIMRKGVLYFIRDPDDPEFHPVRDVLERNVTTQLRKILFSAFVYGALVVVCLGGVVWGLSLTIPSVLPIHYSSNEPVLEFPIDLLFYNFLMPLAVKFFKPSDGLHVMYTWWFRRCARTLSLTWFLFGERRIDEEGTLELPSNAGRETAPWYQKLFLQIDSTGTVAPATWSDIFEGGKSKPASRVSSEEMAQLDQLKSDLVESGQLVPNGRFVRAPASDQVKIPKGRTVFLAVNDRDVRLDGRPDLPEPDLYSGKNYQFVYVPSWFRVRIFLFILFIWMFAAVTGVAFTIVPLVFGRRMFKLLLPVHVKTNDIYAFSIGIYILGSIGYFLLHARTTLEQAREYLSASAQSLMDRAVYVRFARVAGLGLRLAYTYTALLLVFPLAVSLIVEFYLMIPLRTWRYSHLTGQAQALTDGHTVNIVQSWTLGLLYLKIGTRILVRMGGRPAQAARAVLRGGWMDPDINVLTRAFVLPGLLLSIFLLAFPPLVAQAAFSRGLVIIEPWTADKQIVAYRMAYPIAALGWAMLWTLRGILSILERWRARVRDEAYLIGERLHNFGGMVGTGTRGTAATAAGEWRGGARL